MARRAYGDEVAHFFDGVDSDVLFDVRMADLVHINDNGAMEITDTTMMFRFLLRRLFPAVEDSDE